MLSKRSKWVKLKMNSRNKCLEFFKWYHCEFDLIIYLEKWGLIVIFALDLPREVVGDKYSPLFY